MSAKKKIVLVSPAYPYRGGQALVEAYLYNMLTTLGFECSTVSYKLLYPSVFFPGTTQYDVSKVVPFAHPDKIKFVINSIDPLSWTRAAKEINAQKPDGVIFVWWMPFFGPALSTIARMVKKKGAKIIFLVENYVSHEKRWFDHAATRHTLKYADAFITESAYITKQVSGAYPGKPLYQATLSIYDCYDLKRYTRETAKQFLGITTKKVVLFFGLIRAYKGLDKLIAAFKTLLDVQPDTTLLIAGECYEDEKKYTGLIETLGLSDKTVFLNKFLPNEEIEPYFRAADVAVLPYNSGTQSGILMMAYGFKIPVVVTDVGGIAELVADGKTGRVVADNSSNNLVAGINEILTNKDGIDYAANIDNLVGGMGYSNMSAYLNEVLNSN